MKRNELFTVVLSLLIALIPNIAIANVGTVILTEPFGYAVNTKLNSTTASGNWTTGWVANTKVASPTPLPDDYIVHPSGQVNLNDKAMYRGTSSISINDEYDYFFRWDQSLNSSKISPSIRADLRLVAYDTNQNCNFGIKSLSSSSQGQYIPFFTLQGGDNNGGNSNIILNNNTSYTMVGRLSSRNVNGTYAATGKMMAYQAGTTQPGDWMTQTYSANGINNWQFQAIGLLGITYDTNGSVNFKGLTVEKYTKAQLDPIEAAVNTAISTKTWTDLQNARTIVATLIDGIAKDTFAAQLKTIQYTSVPVSSVILNKQSVLMRPNGVAQLSFIVQPSNATYVKTEWASADSSIATVDSNGLVKGLKDGIVNITALVTDDEGTIHSAICQVTVDSNFLVHVTGVTLDKSSLLASIGKPVRLNASIQPPDSTNTTVAWSSADTRIAVVDNDGNITPISAGETQITTVTEDGGYTASCKIKVIEGELVTGIKLDKDSITIAGNTWQLNATVLPENAADKNIIWQSSDINVVTVSSDGMVTPKKVGTATITATTEDGGFTERCTVKVEQAVIINPGGAYEGEMVTFSLAPKNSNGDSVILIRSEWWDKNTVAITGAINNVLYIPSGMAGNQIRIKLFYENTTTNTESNLFLPAIDVLKGIPVEGIVLNKAEVPLFKGQTVRLNAAIKPDNALNKAYSWTSSDTKVAAIDDSGLVTMNGEGSAVITVTSSNGLKTADCTVFTPTDQEAVDADCELLDLGDLSNVTQNLTLPASGTLGTTIKWSSDSAIVSNAGEVIKPLYMDGSKNAVLTAVVSKGSSKKPKQFTVTVTNLSDNKEKDVQDILFKAREALSIGDISSVASDISLPSQVSDGINIVWSSSNTDIISAAGVVKRPAWLTRTDSQITLLAKISYKGIITGKPFMVTVKREDPTEDELPVASGVSIISNQGALEGAYIYKAPENEAEGNSIFKWYVDGELVSSGSKEFGGSSGNAVVFEVTPVTASGLAGHPIRSSAYYSGSRRSGGSGGGSIKIDTGVSAVVAPTSTPQEPSDNIFADVGDEYWAKNDIMQLYQKGILKGTAASTVEPERNITRAEFLALTVRALGLEDTAYNGIFSDVSDGDWYAGVVQTALNNNIVEGDGEEFSPNDVISREQMVKMIVKAYNIKKGSISNKDNDEQFADNSEISDWARVSVQEAKAIGLIKGMPDNRFLPKQGTTRAQAASVIIRLINIIQ